MMSDTQPAADPTPAPTHPDAPLWALRGMALLLVALGIVPTANLLTLADPQRWWAVAVQHWLVWAVLVAGVLWALSRFAPDWCDARRRAAAARILAPSPREFAVAVALLTCALAVFFSWLLFSFEGVTIDELSEQWQAHIMLTGRLTARAEAHPEFFSTMQTVSHDGRWFSHFPIGGPALQAFGMLVRLPWLLNPLLVALAGVAVYRFAAATGEELEARVAALLFAVSPFVLFTAGSKLDHAGTLAAVWIALATLPRWVSATTDRAAMRAAAVVGLALGVATVIRPYDGLLATIAIGLFQLALARRDAVRWRSIGVQALVGALPIAGLLAANHAMTGGAFTFAYDLLNGPDHRPGFHLDPLGFEHTPRHGVYAISSYLMRLNVALLAWPVPAVGVTAAAMALHRRASRWDALLVGMLASTFAGYFYYWGEGSFNGPRFLYTVGPVFLLYIARLPGRLRERTASTRLRLSASLLIPVWVAIAWLSPTTGSQAFGVWTLATRATQIAGFTPLLVDAVKQRKLERALVFVNDGWHARLTARLRTHGAPPYFAQLVVGNFDACEIQQRLDEADHSTAPPLQRAARVFSLLDQPSGASPVPGLSAMEQLALVPGRTVSPECQPELDRALARGADLARLLPLIELDSLGRLGGDVVYARDFGARNELLRDRFGDRTWYTARVRRAEDSVWVELQPYGKSEWMVNRER